MQKKKRFRGPRKCFKDRESEEKQGVELTDKQEREKNVRIS